jgi:hypothetical protein
MRLATTAAALLVLAGCMAPPQSGPKSRKLKYGLFYEAMRPESSKKAELQRKLDRPVAPDIDESYDVSKIRAPRQYSEVAENYELRDWTDGVLLKADADLLRKMREDTSGQVTHLETRLAGLEKEPPTLRKGRADSVRARLDVEKTKLEAINDRLSRLE